MDIAARMQQLAAGTLQRSEYAEHSLSLSRMYSDMREANCCFLAYDLPGAPNEYYRHIDQVIPYIFGEKRCKKILNTTWLIETSLAEPQIKAELRDDFPSNAKIIIGQVRRSNLVYSGLDAESAAWISAS